MATIRPFPALRPNPEQASQICELPYDVMSSEEAREIAAGNPLSFLRVSKPEIDLPPEVSLYDDQVYAKGKENFDRLIREGALRQDERPCYYVYRQIMGSHAQVGFVGAASCQDYASNLIKKHELTRPTKEEDRIRHIEALNAQTGPVFLVGRFSPKLCEILDAVSAQPPEVDFTAPDGVRHSSWTLSSEADITRVEEAFRELPSLYIADGHHRSAAAERVFQKRSGAGQSGYFLSVVFPHDRVRILAYNRAVKDLQGLDSDGFLSKLGAVCSIEPGGDPEPKRAHEVALYLDGRWSTLRFESDRASAADPIEALDVSLLQKLVLGPILGIDDPRRSERVSFIGGIRGTAELEKRVNSGEFACAFSMHPTGVEELMRVADIGGIMPPKSTWFEPKLRDGMFTHMI